MPNLDALQLPQPENWQDFERLCCDLWSRIWSDPDAQLNGRGGQPQAGVDIFGRPGRKDEWVGVQCKLKESLTADDIKDEIKKAKTFQPRLSRFIIATTSPRDARIQEEVRKLTVLQLAEGSFSVSIASWDDIQHSLGTYPDLVQKHFPQFFPSNATARPPRSIVRNLVEAFQRRKQTFGPLITCLSLLTAASAGTWLMLPEASLPAVRRPAIAVLPLQDDSPGKLEVSAFPDSRTLSGMLTDLLDSQSKIRVIPFSESSLVAGHLPRSRNDCLRDESLKQIRKFIGADYVINGSFERFPQKGLQLSLCLQRAFDGKRLLLIDQDFHGESPSLMAFIGNRAGDILKEVGAFVVSRRGQRRFSENDVAVELYFEGIEQLDKYEVRGAAASFCQAKQIDSSFLLSRLALSRAWKELGYDGRAEREAAEIRTRFLESQPTDSDREAALIDAYYHTTREDWKRAIESYRAIWSQYTDYVDHAIELIEVQNLAGATKDALASIARLRELETSGEAFVSDRNRVRLQIQEAIAAMFDDLGREQELAHEAAEAADQLGDSALEARARFLECDALTRLGQDLGGTCETAISRFRSLNDWVNEAKVYQVKGNQALDDRDSGSALQYYNRVLQIFSKAGFQRGRADTLANISYALFDTGREQQARVVCDEALRIATDVRSLTLPEISNDCAFFHAMTGNVRRAKELYQGVLDVARAKGSRATEAAVLGNIAYMLHAERNLDEARDKYLQSIRLSREIGDTEKDFNETLVHYARLLLDTGDLSQARAILQEVFAQYPEEEEAKKLSGEFFCMMRRVLGPGEPRWEESAAELAAFSPDLCTSPAPIGLVLSLPPTEEAPDC